ncbi:glycoside hydrolase family 13 protein [Arthrobacter sp.]|uniref:glycoside hydrolase family 13 protein n=1 Tax=Arthrobacter sp. TaxID=1667 RepID=UPI003A8DCC28
MCPPTPPAPGSVLSAADTPATRQPQQNGQAFAPGPLVHESTTGGSWWRSAVIYQIYPRSFRDLRGTGTGNLAGITAELHQIAELGVDAIWLSPFYPSPQRDAGYDVADYTDVDPLFGTLRDFDALIDRAATLGLRVIIDLVPNHCSEQHAAFQAALEAGPGSAERELFVFRDGRGTGGDEPPNNWQSHFGGPAWTRTTDADGSPGQWYLHLFDSSQPDFNWDSPAVHAEFERVLCFWLDRGVAGFRVDVAHALVKEPGLPDWGGTADGSPVPGFPFDAAPMFGRPGVHAIYRRWRDILAEYDGDRILCAEANAHPVDAVADWVRPDEMHQAFNFPYLNTGWDAPALRAVIDRSLAAFDAVGAPSTWVLSNHDVSRHVTRLGSSAPVRFGDGLGPRDPQPDHAVGLRRARAATLFMLGLPGGAYLYQGEELGLPDHTRLEDGYRQDPNFFRTGGERVGRDGCRIPLPWTPGGRTLGFSPAQTSWLPQPDDWAQLARSVQRGDAGSTLSLYCRMLAARRRLGLGSGTLQWLSTGHAPGVIAFENRGIAVVLNTSSASVDLPAGEVLLASGTGDIQHDAGISRLGPEAAVWLRRTPSST